MTISRGFNTWDHHGNIFPPLSETFLPELDNAFATLLEDLASHGLLRKHWSLSRVSSDARRKSTVLRAAIIGQMRFRCALQALVYPVAKCGEKRMRTARMSPRILSRS